MQILHKNCNVDLNRPECASIVGLFRLIRRILVEQTDQSRMSVNIRYGTQSAEWSAEFPYMLHFLSVDRNSALKKWNFHAQEWIIWKFFPMLWIGKSTFPQVFSAKSGYSMYISAQLLE